ncbi:MAG: TonB-dependent receptor [Candidatus Methylopumilus sp.]
MKKTTIAGLIGLLFNTPTFATETTIDADNVIVTTARVHEDIQNIPANIQVIRREDIQEINAISIPQVLTQLGGLNVTGTALGQFNRGATVDIGGYGATGGSTTLVLVNGQRISPIDSAAVPWEIIPIASIDRIEIIKGSAGVQYGDRAVGGVINIVTNESQQSINQASATVGSFGSRGVSAILQNKIDDTLFKVSANANHSDGWRQNTASDQYSVDARITQFFDKNSAYVEVFGNHNKNETPGAVIAPIGQGNPQSVKCDIYSCFIGAYNKYDNYGLAFGTNYELTERVKFEGDFSYKNTKSEFFKDGDNQSDPSSVDYALYTIPHYYPYSANYNRWRIDFSPRLKIDLAKLGQLVLGYDYGRAAGSQSDASLMTGYSSFSNSSASLVDNSFYLNHRLPIQENLDLIAGFRRQIENITANDGSHDDYGASAFSAQKTTAANAWELGLNYRFSSSEKVYVKYGQSFRFPNLDEFWGYNGYARTFFGGIINPQTDRTAEVGSEFVLGNTKFTTSLFHTKTEDEIRYQVATGKNINDANIVERNGLYLSTVSAFTERLSFYTNAKLQEAVYTSGPYNGKSFDLVPHLLVNARLNYKLDNDWSLGLVSNYVGSQYYDGANDKGAYTKMPSYILTDLYVGKKIDHWDLRLAVKNIANEHYASYGGYQNKNNSSFYAGYYYYPNDPRSVFASLSYNF